MHWNFPRLCELGELPVQIPNSVGPAAVRLLDVLKDEQIRPVPGHELFDFRENFAILVAASVFDAPVDRPLPFEYDEPETSGGRVNCED